MKVPMEAWLEWKIMQLVSGWISGILGFSIVTIYQTYCGQDGYAGKVKITKC